MTLPRRCRSLHRTPKFSRSRRPSSRPSRPCARSRLVAPVQVRVRNDLIRRRRSPRRHVIRRVGVADKSRVVAPDERAVERRADARIRLCTDHEQSSDLEAREHGLQGGVLEGVAVALLDERLGGLRSARATPPATSRRFVARSRAGRTRRGSRDEHPRLAGLGADSVNMSSSPRQSPPTPSDACCACDPSRRARSARSLRACARSRPSRSARRRDAPAHRARGAV